MFEIQFQGVITHARVASSLDGLVRQIAVLYNVPRVRHVPLLTLRDDDVLDIRPNDVMPIGTGDGVKCYRISGELTTNLTPGLPTQYLSHVPRLTDLTSARRPRASIGNRDPDPRFSAYVVLGKGAMHEADWFPRKGQFGVTSQAICLPRTITYTAVPDTVPFSPRVEITMTSERADGEFIDVTFELVKNALLRVSNIEANSNPAAAHFDTYANFFRGPNTVIQRPIQITDPCEATSAARRIATCYRNEHLSVECSNTLYP